LRLDLLVNDFTTRRIRFAPSFYSGPLQAQLHPRSRRCPALIHAISQSDSMRGQAYQCGPLDANLSEVGALRGHQGACAGFVILQSSIAEDPDKRDYIVSNAKIEATVQAGFSLRRRIEELIKGYQMCPRRLW